MDIKKTVKAQKEFFDSGRTKRLSFRRHCLERLRDAVKENEGEILEALKLDLGKSEFEAYSTEIGLIYKEISHMLSKLTKWASPEKGKFSLVNFPSKGRIYKEPFGSVLIMSPWNYPFQLAIMPLIGAMAAGNCAVVKPSAYAPHTGEILKKIIEETFEPFYVAVVLGGREENKNLIDEDFDYIFFTGSTKVAKTIMESAAKKLIPATLELGGKSPVIVDKDANVDMAARRIVWGKFLNCGQTCVAPDYVLVHRDIKERLMHRMVAYIEAMYGKKPLESQSYGKIINEKHFSRLLDSIVGEEIYYDGYVVEKELKLGPVIVDEPALDSILMTEEIFGPILPVLGFDNLEDAMKIVKDKPKPLSLYVFTENEEVAEGVLAKLSFGGGCVNDTVMHLTLDMPFGGVGYSGMGKYHGEYSFNTFSNLKGILKKGTYFDLPLRYPIGDLEKIKELKDIGMVINGIIGEKNRTKLLRKIMK